MTVTRYTWDEAISPLNMAVAQHTLRSSSEITFKTKIPLGKITDTKNSQYSLGLYYCEVLNEKDEALKVFSNIIRQDPKYIYPYLSKGDILLKMGKNEDSIKCYTQALEKAKDDSQKGLILGKIGYSYFLLQNYKEAATFFQNALTTDKERPEWYNNAGCCKVLLGDLKGGIDLFNHALKIDSHNIEIQLNKIYSALLQDGAKCILDFVLSTSVHYSDRRDQRHAIDVIIDQYLTRKKGEPLNNQYFGLSYILIGDVEKGQTFFENKLDIKMVSIDNQIKKIAFDSVINYLLIDRPSSYEPFYFLLILNICGPAFVIEKIESSQKGSTENSTLFNNLLKFAKYIDNPDNTRVMTPVVEYYQALLHEFNYEKNKDHLFHKLFKNTLFWEKQADEKYNEIRQNFSKIYREYTESGKKGSIFDPVITLYQNILDNDPDCLRVKEKLAIVYQTMGGQHRIMANAIIKEINQKDPTNEYARTEIQKMNVQPLRESDLPKNLKKKHVSKKNKKDKRGKR
jgi:tetratricopeptide (TPR) repeat protein